MRCNPRVKHRCPLIQYMHRQYCVPDRGQRLVNDVVKIPGLHRIDYVVLNAGILKYPNVSQAYIRQVNSA